MGTSSLDEELRLSAARASGIVSISADAIVSIDENQRITMFNDGAEKIFGYAKAEAIGAQLDLLIPDRFRSSHNQHVQTFASGQETARRMGERGKPIFGLRKNGEEFPADAAISRLDVGGRLVLTVSLRDISDQKRLEDERAALLLEHVRLYRAAQRAIQVRDDVLGIVAHDLRNPLNAILMQAALIRLVADGESQSILAAERIERAANRMSRLIQDLLDVSLMEAGQLSMEQSHVSVAELVADAAEAQKALVSSASLDLSLDVAGDSPDVWADRDRLLQVFENLIGNAAKFSQPGGRIIVGAAPRADEVTFWVADTGSGIARGDVPHLFDRYWQAQRAERNGAGLGLPIAKGIVEAHRGRIWVESELGSGTTFFFTIPTGTLPDLHEQQASPA